MPDATTDAPNPFVTLGRSGLGSFRDGDAHVIVLAGELRVIVMAHRRQAGRLIVVKGPRQVHRVFAICNLVWVLPLVEKFPDDVVV